jgi:hypothetical protein
VAVLCRVAGVPARVVSGFAPGVYDPDQDVFRIRERDWHAWVEVFIPGYGWHEMDASPVVDLDAVMQERSKPGWIASVGAWTQQALTYIEQSRVLLGIVAGAGVVAGVLLALLIQRRRRRKVASRPVTFPTAHERVRRAYRRMNRIAARRFRAKLPAETPHEYLAALERWLGTPCPPAGRLTAEYVTVMYAAADNPPLSPHELHLSLRQLKAVLKGG